ncbi:hypothetical protein GCM10009850_040990 [Nonomuraea monospora]|uniref:Uncharacterized protein n=1 Tax=Nonomuraea monospora TaxID=568818 RepID=A0ABP5PC76_9ACTN
MVLEQVMPFPVIGEIVLRDSTGEATWIEPSYMGFTRSGLRGRACAVGPARSGPLPPSPS